MKTYLSFCRTPRVTLLGLASLLAAALVHAEVPVIQSIQVERTNVVVVVRVPSGQARVQLESRGHLGMGAWVPAAVQRVAGQSATITFRLPRSGDFAFLRVRADATEPLPESFYKGTNSFDVQPASGAGDIRAFDTAGPAGGATSDSREVVESDIWRLDGDTLYFFNQLRGLQIIDVSNPDAATLRGTLNLPAAGEQMYLLSSNHVVLLARANCSYDESQVMIVSVSNGVPALRTALPVPGQIIESRLVGTALYVATQTYRPVSGSANTQWDWGTQVASFDLSVPAAPVARSSLWYSGYGNVIAATDTYLFAVMQHPTNWQQSIVNLIDITAPDGTMHTVGSILPAGLVADKFKLNWADAVLSVISEVSSPALKTKLETFRLPDPRSASPIIPFKLGQVELGHGERLFATRFDGTRAYAVTFVRIDPLWIVDLSNPLNPKVSGELQVPGWSTFIQPLSNRLVTVGIETNRATVSLFDVSNTAHPALLSRAQLGSDYSSTEANWDEKAFTVLESDGLILLPVQSYTTNGASSWIQIIDLAANSLKARGRIEHEFTPRRATLHRNRIVSLSGSELLSVNAADRDHPQLSGRLELSWAINRVLLAGNYLIEITAANGWNSEASPLLRVAPALSPDAVLSTFTLTNAPVSGATIRSNRLYLVQANNDTALYGIDAPGSNSIWLTVVDLSNLPALNVLGQTVAVTTPLGWNSELEPLWLRPDLLVWSGSGNSYWWGPWYIRPLGGIASLTGFWPYGQSGGGRLFAFDVSNDAAPALLSETDLTTNGWWSFSKAFASDGLVYLSHQAYVDPDTNGWSAYMRNWLDVVDFADARHPTTRSPVSIPGTLQGISHSGALLYTVGFHPTSTNGYSGFEALDASAYDGISAYLVDSVSFSNVWQHPVLVSGSNVFLGRGQIYYNSTNTSPPMLETWTLANDGKFKQLGGLKLSTDASDFVSFPGLLAVQTDGSSALVFDLSNPAALRQVGEGPAAGCLYFNLRHADAAPARALWLPLDDYGVTSITLSP